MVQHFNIWSNRIHSLKYLWSSTLDCKDIRIRKLEFVIKTQFHWMKKPQISFKKNQHFHSYRASFDNFLTIGPLVFSQIYTPDFLNFYYNIRLIYKLQMLTWETKRTSLLAGGYDGGETPTRNFISHFYKKEFLYLKISALVWSS